MDSMFNTLLARALAGGGGGGTGTDDYTDLNNKPKVNNVTVVGDLTSSDLKLQGEITNANKLSADLIDDSNTTNKFNVQADWNQATNSAPDYIKNKPTLGTAAATDATAYATSAQGTKADSAIQGVKVNDVAVAPDSNKIVSITVPTTAADVSALPNTTKYAAALSLTINSSTYVVTGQLKDQNGDNLGTAQTIDLPLESVVVGGSYDSQTKKVILTLQNGNTVEFSVADLVSGLQTELSATNKLDPSFINYDTTHAAVTESDKTTWSGKQDALTFDGTYSASTNKAATVSTVTNAVNALDVTGDASVSASKTISAWSETDGKVSISTQDIAITGTQTTLTGYAKSGTAGQAVAATDNVNQAIGKLEATVDDNKTNISSCQAFTNNATIDSDRKLYISAVEPTGDIPTGSTWIDGKTIKVFSFTDIWTGNIEQGSWGSESLYKVTSENRCRTDSAVSVVSGKTYTINLTGAQVGLQLLLQYRNASDVTISESGWKSAPYSSVIPENATQITILFRKSDNSNLTPLDIDTLSIIITEWE